MASKNLAFKVFKKPLKKPQKCKIYFLGFFIFWVKFFTDRI